MRLVVTALAVTFSLLPLLPAQGAGTQDPDKAEIQELRDRITDLEDLVLETDEKVGSRALWNAYSDVDNVDLGGHLLSSFTHMDGDQGSETGHYITLLELFVKVKFDDNWSLFASPGFFNVTVANQTNQANPTLSPNNTGLIVARSFLEYKDGEKFSVQAGVIGTPHGVTNREYFLPSRLILNGPSHVRTFLSNQLYALNMFGARAAGRINLEEDASRAFIYDAYLGTATDNPNELLFGGRAGYRLEELGLEIALNYSHGTRGTFAENNPMLAAFGAMNPIVAQSPFPSAHPFRASYDVFGVDIDWRKDANFAKVEVYTTEEENFQDKDAVSFRVGRFWTPQFATTIGWDYFDYGYNLGVSRETTLGLMVEPIENIRIRLDSIYQQLPNVGPGIDDLAIFNLSFTAAF